VVSTSSAPSGSWSWGDFQAEAPWFDDAAIVFQCHSDAVSCDDSVVIFGNRVVVMPSGGGAATSVEFESVVSWQTHRDGDELMRLELEAAERVEARVPLTFERPLARTLTRLLGSGRGRGIRGS
jgi:hypothetical protein